MVTFVGMQDDFASALEKLLELEFDAAEAYEAAFERLKNEEYKEKIKSFKEDHHRHISAISELLKNHGFTPPTGPSTAHQWMTKGKVVIGGLMGDLAILRAMRSNEIDTNTAYERMHLHEQAWADAKDLLREGLKDEQRHKKWLEYIMEGGEE